MERSYQIWQWTFLFWVGATLSFMAAMSVSGVLVVLTSAYFMRKGVPWKPVILRSLYLKATAAMIVVGSLSLLYCWLSPPLGLEMEGFREVKKFLYFLQPPLMAWAILALCHKQKRSIEDHPFWWVLYGVSFIVSLIGIYQFWAGYFFSLEHILEHPRFFRKVPFGYHSHAQGVMFFHLSFATAIGFSYCYSAARFLWRRPKDSTKVWLAWGTLAMLNLLAGIYTYSRIAWLAFFVGTIFLFGLRKPRWGVVIALVLLMGGTYKWVTDDDIRNRFFDRAGWSDRANIWAASFEMVKDRPLLGVGFAKSGHYTDVYAERAFGKNEGFASHAHNNVLDTLATTGILGLLAFLAWWGILIYYAWGLYRKSGPNERWLPAALLAAALLFHLNGLTQVNFYDAKSQHSLVLWVSLVLALTWRTELEELWEKNQS